MVFHSKFWLLWITKVAHSCAVQNSFFHFNMLCEKLVVYKARGTASRNFYHWHQSLLVIVTSHITRSKQQNCTDRSPHLLEDTRQEKNSEYETYLVWCLTFALSILFPPPPFFSSCSVFKSLSNLHGYREKVLQDKLMKNIRREGSNNSNVWEQEINNIALVKNTIGICAL